MPNIQQIVAQRGITAVVHFTRVQCLPSIIQHGLLPRDVCQAPAYGAVFNDPNRNDRTNAVSATIEYPNYRMFYPMRTGHPDVDWVVIAIRPSVLWETDCAFCHTNAAFGDVTAIPLDQRKGEVAFENMFAERGKNARSVLGIPDRYTTDPQAEVLLLNGAPPQFIMGAIVEKSALQAQLAAQYPGFQTVHRPNYFRGRMDYRHWQTKNG